MLGKAVESVVRSRLGVRPRSRDPLTWVPSVRVRAPERGFEATQLKGRFYSPTKEQVHRCNQHRQDAHRHEQKGWGHPNPSSYDLGESTEDRQDEHPEPDSSKRFE